MQTYQLIQYEQRVLIAYHPKAGLGNNEIGRILSIDKSVISREISRNSRLWDNRIWIVSFRHWNWGDKINKQAELIIKNNNQKWNQK